MQKGTHEIKPLLAELHSITGDRYAITSFEVRAQQNEEKEFAKHLEAMRLTPRRNKRFQHLRHRSVTEAFTPSALMASGYQQLNSSTKHTHRSDRSIPRRSRSQCEAPTTRKRVKAARLLSECDQLVSDSK